MDKLKGTTRERGLLLRSGCYPARCPGEHSLLPVPHGEGIGEQEAKPFQIKGNLFRLPRLAFHRMSPLFSGHPAEPFIAHHKAECGTCAASPPQRVCQCIPAAPVQHRTRRQGCSQPSRCQGPGADSGCCSGWVFVFHSFWQTRQRQLNGER